MYLRKSISLLEALKDEAMLEDLALYYCKLGTVLISQGVGGGGGGGGWGGGGGGGGVCKYERFSNFYGALISLQ